MNSYYANVGITTNQTVGASVKKADHFLNKHMKRNTKSIIAHDFTETDIIDACKSLNNKKSHDAYGLTQAVVLSDVGIIAPIITHIANCSINTGVCPDLTKIARVIPIYKNKGDKQLYSNY